MDIHVQPDSDKQKQFQNVEQKEFEKQFERKPRDMVQGKMDGINIWAGLDEISGYQSPQKKLAIERQNEILTQKVELKSDHCWTDGCKRRPSVWVREVQFDMHEGHKVEANHAQVSSADYTGPVPGFCFVHLTRGPAELAQAVYFDRGEIQWGFRPERWWMIFTDGTKTGGSCVQLNPHNIKSVVTDTQIMGEESTKEHENGLQETK